ncbi:MAG: hypothetical protein AABZ47_10695, partial [Planctomycetota bacterium]
PPCNQTGYRSEELDAIALDLWDTWLPIGAAPGTPLSPRMYYFDDIGKYTSHLSCQNADYSGALPWVSFSLPENNFSCPMVDPTEYPLPLEGEGTVAGGTAVLMAPSVARQIGELLRNEEGVGVAGVIEFPGPGGPRRPGPSDPDQSQAGKDYLENARALASEIRRTTGARDVTSMTLVPTSSSKNTNISAGEISGNLGDLIVQQESSGQGGVVSLTIGGDVNGEMTIPKVDTLEVKGAVSSGGSITVDEFVGNKRVDLNGISSGGNVVIQGLLADNASVDLNGQEVAGGLSFRGGSAYSSLISAGQLTGSFGLVSAGLGPAMYSGSTTVTSIAYASTLYMENSVLEGGINIDGDCDGFIVLDCDSVFGPDGHISIGGDLTSSGYLYFGPAPEENSGIVFIGQDCDGTIEASGDLAGAIVVLGDLYGLISGDNLLGYVSIAGSGLSTGSIEMRNDFGLEESSVYILGDYAGNIHADSDGIDGGRILGSVSVYGEFNGDICGANLTPGGPLPGNIDIPDFGCDATICGWGPTVPAEAEGSRYIRTTGVNDTYPIALSVELDENPCVDVTCACLPRYVQDDGSLDNSPYFQYQSDWSSVRIADSQIIPGKTYVIRTQRLFAQEPDPVCGTTVTTRIWGDTFDTGNGVVDVDDLGCVIFGFADVFAPPYCTRQSADLLPCEQPDGVIGLEDLLALLDAFAGNPYTDTCPDPCSGENLMMAPGGGESSGMSSEGEGGQGAGGMGMSTATISAVGNKSSMKPNSVLTVNVFVDSPIALRGYQVALDVSGGSAGTLSLESLVVTDTRTDFVFYTLSDVPAIDNGNARVASALFSGTANGTPAKYLATYTYRASSDAHGMFVISPRQADTLLRDANREAIAWEAVNWTVEVK